MRHQFATRQLLSSQDQFCCTRKWWCLDWSSKQTSGHAHLQGMQAN
jgi:hypothetical protein